MGKISNVDRTTFAQEFLHDEIEEHVKFIASLVHDRIAKWSFTFEQLGDEIGEHDPEVLALALTRMIGERRRVLDSFGNICYIMQRARSYVLQPVEDIAANATSSERDDDDHLPGTPVEVTFDAPITPKTPRSGIARAREIVAGVNDAVGRAQLELETAVPVPTDILYDYFVDRLDHRSLRHVCLTLLYADDTKSLIKELNAAFVTDSLVTAKLLHRAGPKQQGFVMFLDPYTLRKHLADGTEQQVTSHEEVEPLGIAAKPYYEHRPNAFVTIDGNTGCQFKVVGKEKHAAGSVCQQTSTIEVRMLVDMIRAVEPKFLRKGAPYSKKQLCMLYELALRMRRDCPHSIMRPAWWIFQYRLRFFRHQYV